MLDDVPNDRDGADAWLLRMIKRIKAAPPQIRPIGPSRRQAVLAAGRRLQRSDFRGLDRHFVPWTIQDGRWLGALAGRPPKSLLAIGPNGAGPMINPLGSPFGMRLLIYLADDRRRLHYASLPITETIVETLWLGRLDVVYCHLQGDAALEVDFSVAAESLAAYQAILQRALSVSADYARDSLLLPMPALAMRRAVVDQELLHKRFDAQDWLELGWYEAAKRAYGILVNDPFEPKLDLVETIREPRYPAAAWLLPYLRLMQDRNLPTGTRIGQLLDSLADGDTMAKLVREIISFDMAAPWLRDRAECSESDTEIATALSYLMTLFCHAMLHPDVSANGRRLVSIAGGERRVLDFIELNPHHFPGARQSPEIARSFWPNFWIEDPPIDLKPTIGPTDLPMRVEDAQAFDWAAFVGDLSADVAETAAQDLLKEASALKQWVVPPEAWLDLPLGPFVGADVHELNEDVILVWRLPDGRFFRVIIGGSTGRIMHTRPPVADEALARRAGAAIGLLSAAIVRDFWVVEERARVFGVQRPRAVRAVRGSPRSANQRVVYLPRYRYVASAAASARLTEGLRQAARARHYVKPHFRKVANPSPVQLEQARGLLLEPPPGHTFVRGHYRGDRTHERVYRSRAALALLAGLELEQVSQADDDWFSFESSMAELFRRLGYTVLQRSARGRCDEGIDILATRTHSTGKENWLIQCKAYAPDRPVGVGAVRDLIGALTDFAHRYATQPRGLLVTTSRFSAEATRLATVHGIQLVDSASLLAIFEVENRRAYANTPGAGSNARKEAPSQT